jgi:hypothetical protein
VVSPLRHRLNKLIFALAMHRVAKKELMMINTAATYNSTFPTDEYPNSNAANAQIAVQIARPKNTNRVMALQGELF